MLYWKRFSINKFTFNLFNIMTICFTVINSFIYLLYCIIKNKINWDEFMELILENLISIILSPYPDILNINYFFIIFIFFILFLI